MVVDKVTSLVLFSLLTAMVRSEPVKVTMKCALRECTRQFSECAANKYVIFLQNVLPLTLKQISSKITANSRVCLRTNACMSQCGPGSKARCLFDCGYLNKDIPLGPFVDCVARSGCANTTEFGRLVLVWQKFIFSKILFKIIYKDLFFLFVCSKVHWFRQ